MVQPDTSRLPYFQYWDRKMDFQDWWKRYQTYESDYWIKCDTELFPYVLEAAPERWYSRLVFNMYTPVQRNTVKLFLPLSFDYESIILGSAIGMYITFCHYRLCKSPQLRTGDSFCTGRNNHFYQKWHKTHINPRKYFKYNRKIFWRKFFSGIPDALTYGVIATSFVHGFSSQSFSWVDRALPLFIGTTWITYDIYLYDQDYQDCDYNFYRHPELYALGLLALYSMCRIFRSYVSNIPFKRVLIG